VNFLIGQGDINEEIYLRMIEEHKMHLEDTTLWDKISSETVAKMQPKK